METEIIIEIIKKLNGRIDPVGETHIDNERFENLKKLCDIIESLICDIDSVAYENRDRYEFSMKRSAEFASSFLKDRLGIE